MSGPFFVDYSSRPLLSVRRRPESRLIAAKLGQRWTPVFTGMRKITQAAEHFSQLSLTAHRGLQYCSLRTLLLRRVDAELVGVAMKSTVLALSLVLFYSTHLHAQAHFYEGKTAKIIAVLEMRNNIMINYGCSYHVGNCTFKTISCFDT